MKKGAAVAVMIFLTAMLLGGCWNYRGLNEMSITAGVAIDRETDTGLYHLSIEYIDLTKPVKQQGIKAGLLESYGTTLFDAVRNAKKRIVNKVYLGHTGLLVLGEDVAQNTDISTIIDLFLRDAECRETMCVAVSQEPKAKDLLSIEGIGQPMVAFEIQKIIEEDHKVTSSIPYVELYEIYNILNSPGIELALPAFHNTMNDGEPASEANGTAVFRGERLVGYLTPEETRYFLFATNEVQGGVITCASQEGGPEDATLEISKSETKTSFDYQNGQLTMDIETETDVFLDETVEPMDALDKPAIKTLETGAAQKVVKGIGNVIEKVRTDFGSDIFGFGNKIYKRDLKLWKQLQDQWDDVFRTMAVNVKGRVNIINTASIKKS